MKRVKQKHGGVLNVLGPGETANPNGRPPKLFTEVTKKLQARGFTRVKQIHIIEGFELVIGLPRHELLAMAMDEDMPMLLRIVAKELMASGGFEVVEKVLDRIHGKAIQQNKNVVDLTVGVEWFEVLPEEAKFEIVKKIEEVRYGHSINQTQQKEVEEFVPAKTKRVKNG